MKCEKNTELDLYQTKHFSFETKHGEIRLEKTFKLLNYLGKAIHYRFYDES